MRIYIRWCIRTYAGAYAHIPTRYTHTHTLHTYAGAYAHIRTYTHIHVYIIFFDILK